MTESKKPISIENAIGNRAKKESPKVNQIPQNPSEIPDVPSPSEMLSLEELNRQTEERLQDDPRRLLISQEGLKIPVSKPDPQPVTTTSSQESQPPQGSKELDAALISLNAEIVSELPDAINAGLKEIHNPISAEDRDLTALKAYILNNGFVVSGVAMHIVMLCAAPLVTTSTTDWDFEDRQHIPDMVYGLLRQPGYIDGIWPSLKIVMGISGGNSAWTAGIATSIAFFDVIRTLPTLKALKK